MKKMLRNNSVMIKSFFVVVSATFLVMMAVHAWQEPGSPPPGGNVDPPLHQGNTVQTKTGGLNVMGNVGIGTATPTNILSFGNTADRTFWIENSASGTVGRALTVAAGGTVAGGTDISGGNLILQSGLGTGTGASTISFQTGTTLATGTTLQTTSTKMTILGNGNVGIGTTSPGAKLNVDGTVLVGGTTLPFDGAFKFNVVSSDAGFIVVTNLPTDSTTGRAFTIGAPGEGYTRINFYSNGFMGMGSGGATRDVFIGRSAANTLRIGGAYDGSGTGNLIVNGNVGIGTTSPSELLHVVKSHSETNVVLAGAFTTGWPSGIAAAGTGVELHLGTPLGATRGGRIGVIKTDAIDNKHDMYFSTSIGNAVPAERVRITHTGNVGIGTTTPDRRLEIGSGLGNARADGWDTHSDVSFKKNIADLAYGLKEIMQMKPREFDIKVNNTHRIGFIAQELENIIPEVVSGEEGKKGVTYSDITAVLVKAMQEQQEIIEEQNKRIEALESQINKK
jgi:hypothetical protein